MLGREFGDERVFLAEGEIGFYEIRYTNIELVRRLPHKVASIRQTFSLNLKEEAVRRFSKVHNSVNDFVA